MAKLRKKTSNTNFSATLYKVIADKCVNGTHPGFNALAVSLKRGEALLSQSTNVKEVASHV